MILRYFLVLVCVFLSVTGCATGREAVNTIDSRLTQLRIGMTKSEVVALIGKPTIINTTITASGKHEQWVYSEWTLAANLLTTGQEASYGMMRGLQRRASGSRRDLYWYFYFDNDVLTVMQEQ